MISIHNTTKMGDAMEIEDILKEMTRLRNRQDYLREMLSRKLSDDEIKQASLISSQNKWIMEKINSWLGKLK